MKWFIAFLPICLLASVNEPLRLEFLTGYRNDHIHWHEEGYGELYNSLQFWENALSLRSIHRDIAVYVRGGFGAFGQGTLDQSPAGTERSTSGWALDGTGYFGYAANLTPDRTYKAMVIPLVGFSGHYEQLNRSALPKYYQQTWFGPYLGGAIKVEPGNRLLFEVGYAFNWLHLRATDQYFIDGTLSKMKYSGWGSHGQSGWVQGDFELTSAWHIGLFGQIDYFYSGMQDQFKLRWTSLSGMAVVSRQL